MTKLEKLRRHLEHLERDFGVCILAHVFDCPDVVIGFKQPISLRTAREANPFCELPALDLQIQPSASEEMIEHYQRMKRLYEEQK